MGLESASFLHGLEPNNPLSGDYVSEGDNHLRLIKAVLKATFPGLAGAFARVENKSAYYTVQTTDNTVLFNCTATMTLATTQAATLGNGFVFAVYTNGYEVTLDPYGSETINGSTTLLLPKYAFVVVWCTGSAFVAMIIPQRFSLVAVSTYTANGTWYRATNSPNKIMVMAVGGGGGGGGAGPAYSGASAGLGGKAGSIMWGFTAAPATSYAVTIGAGGTGVSGSFGNTGGTTSFGSLVSAVGGRGGIVQYIVNAPSSVIYGECGDSCLASGGSVRSSVGNGYDASANTGAGGGGAMGDGTGYYTGGTGGSGRVVVWEFV